MNGLCLGVIILCVQVSVSKSSHSSPPNPLYAMHWGSFYRYRRRLALCPGSLFQGQEVMSNHNGLRTLYRQQQPLHTSPLPPLLPNKTSQIFYSDCTISTLFLLFIIICHAVQNDPHKIYNSCMIACGRYHEDARTIDLWQKTTAGFCSCDW